MDPLAESVTGTERSASGLCHIHFCYLIWREQKHHPAEAAVVFKILPDCPLRRAQYLLTLQSVRHVNRATSYCF